MWSQSCASVCVFISCDYVPSEELYSPEELLAMIFNSSRQVAQDYAGKHAHMFPDYVLYRLMCTV